MVFSSLLWTVSFQPSRRHAVRPSRLVPPTGGISPGTARALLISQPRHCRPRKQIKHFSALHRLYLYSHPSRIGLRGGRAPTLTMEPAVLLRGARSALRWAYLSARLLQGCRTCIRRASGRERRDRLRLWHELARRLLRLSFKRRQWAFLGMHLRHIKERGKAV